MANEVTKAQLQEKNAKLQEQIDGALMRIADYEEKVETLDSIVDKASLEKWFAENLGVLAKIRHDASAQAGHKNIVSGKIDHPKGQSTIALNLIAAGPAFEKRGTREKQNTIKAVKVEWD